MGYNCYKVLVSYYYNNRYLEIYAFNRFGAKTNFKYRSNSAIKPFRIKTRNENWKSNQISVPRWLIHFNLDILLVSKYTRNNSPQTKLISKNIISIIIAITTYMKKITVAIRTNSRAVFCIEIAYIQFRFDDWKQNNILHFFSARAWTSVLDCQNNTEFWIHRRSENSGNCTFKSEIRTKNYNRLSITRN